MTESLSHPSFINRKKDSEAWVYIYIYIYIYERLRAERN